MKGRAIRRYLEVVKKKRKHPASECDNAKCLICHSAKVFKEPTIQEKRFTGKK